jgi:hypothetical protein
MYEVLQTRRYDRLMGRTWDVFDTFADFIERMFGGLRDRTDLGFIETIIGAYMITRIIAYATIFIVIAGVVLAVIFIWRNRRVKMHSLHEIFEDLAQNDYTVESLLHMSDTAQYLRDAVRYRYIAVLLALDEGGALRLRPSMTTKVIMNELATSQKSLCPLFLKITYTYHLAWFGQKEIADIDAYTETCGTLIAAAGGHHA